MRKPNCYSIIARAALALSLLLSLPALPAGPDFAGAWHWSKGSEELTLHLEQADGRLTGHHSAIGQGGMKADEVPDSGPPSITGKVNGGVATVDFNSGFPDSQGGGKARLSLKAGFLYWKVLKSTGEHYLPLNAKLSRVK
jgi:hypothetical protein